MTDITPAVAAVETSGTPALASPPKTPAGVTPPVGQRAISWHMPTPSQWVAYRGHTRIGSIHQLGAFIATNQHMDVIGAFVELSGAQLAIADPHAPTLTSSGASTPGASSSTHVYAEPHSPP